jgi:hypothetical protein
MLKYKAKRKDLRDDHLKRTDPRCFFIFFVNIISFSKQFQLNSKTRRWLAAATYSFVIIKC